MTLELSQQSLAWLFLLSLIMGFAAGAVYDLIKFRRKLINFGKIPEIIVMSIEDLCFFLVWSVAFCILLYATTYGEVRIEAIFSQILGFFIYRKTLGIPFGKLSDMVARPVKKLFVKLVKKLKIHKSTKTKKQKKRRKRKDRNKNERTR